MGLDKQESAFVKLRPVVEGCNELSFVAFVPQQVMWTADPPNPGDLYEAWVLPGKTQMRDEFMAYEYVGPEDGPEGYLGFAFSKSKTEAEKATPFRSSTKFDDFTWHMVLKGIAVIADYGFPQSTYAVVDGQKTLVSAPRYYPREIFIPQTTCPTKFTVDEFISPTKFVIPQHPVPLPMPVNYQVLGEKREFPLCLHDDLTLRATRTGTAQIVAGGTGGARSGAVGGYDFPATNFKEWTAHYIHDDQQFTNGVWHRVRIRVTPPPMPKATSQ